MTEPIWDRERGSATLELAIITPALLLVLGLVVVGGRVQVASGALEHAAATAAREASLMRTRAAAQAAATAAAARELDGQDLRCAATSTTVDTSGLARGVRQPATVAVTLTCTVSFADFALPGLPGARTLTATATSPVDRFRGR
ncbi:TadE/TadG family type IV pilus assembly protein [Cellulomonas cellasea]|uniref:Pilus assembly protein TadE n=2 Tax=Cellulomonas cellasea TaxID=43670 RepID=A0A0A0BF10_9CELL|nr:TadE/TadG family type IV pilus assembly protein [Cellulomonas cellasea]KGM03921.1 pilus assembly protein TadE [Cellulomonas cellasea DSM 20118]GEA89066.1 membrane protein [Cellulomonas cellasea]